MYQYMDYLAGEFPQLVTIERVGMSNEKRELRVAKVSNGGPPKATVFIEGGGCVIYLGHANWPKMLWLLDGYGCLTV